MTTQIHIETSRNGVHPALVVTKPQTSPQEYIPTEVHDKSIDLQLFKVKDPSILADIDRLKAVLRESIEAGNLHIVKANEHKFEGGGEGSTHVFILSESEFSVSTWPEFGYLSAQIHTCGQTSDPWKTGNHLIEALQPSDFIVKGTTTSDKVEIADTHYVVGRRMSDNGKPYYSLQDAIQPPPGLSAPMRSQKPLPFTK